MIMNNKQFLVFLLTFSILTALALPFAAVIPSEEEAAVYDNVIRLHVLANSDSDEDQSLKLKVRDGILSTAAELVEGCTDFETARDALERALPELKDAAISVLRREGSDYDVRVTLTREDYPTREYRGVTLPAGEYTSLRVLIGEAAGHNWWCVLFPQLCVTAASSGSKAADFTILDDTEPLVEAGLTPSQIELITGDSPRVTVKFRLLEWLKSLKLQ